MPAWLAAQGVSEPAGGTLHLSICCFDGRAGCKGICSYRPARCILHVCEGAFCMCVRVLRIGCGSAVGACYCVAAGVSACQNEGKQPPGALPATFAVANCSLDISTMHATNTCPPLLCSDVVATGWFISLFQRRHNKFLGKYRFWVEPAKPPEDYIYENLSVTRFSRYIRLVRSLGGLCSSVLWVQHLAADSCVQFKQHPLQCTL